MWYVGKILEFTKKFENIEPGYYLINSLNFAEHPDYSLKKIAHLGNHGERTYEEKDGKIITAKILTHQVKNRKDLRLPILLKSKKQLIKKFQEI